MGGVWDFFFGKKAKMKQYNKGSARALENIATGGGLQGNATYGAGNTFLQNLLQGGPEAFKAFEAPYMRQFEEQIAPGIAERYTGAGGTGAGGLMSSNFQQSLAHAGAGLSEQLAALRGGLQMQALPQALQYAQQPISNQMQAAQAMPGQYYERPGSKGLVQSAIEQAVNAYVGGGAGGGGGNVSALIQAIMKAIGGG